MFAKIQRIHFVGIGGIGMSGIAEVLLNLGYKVSGSDLKSSAVTQRLASLGATVFEGHRAENIAGAEVVVASSAIGSGNPEIFHAHTLHIPVIQRAEMLAELMRLKYGIAIAGMHGKTTTTSMVAAVLAGGGLDPTVVVGGRVDAMGSNARLGKSQYLVAEADESDRSFLRLSPILAVVTNVDREHMDCYRNMRDVKRAFLDFMDRVPFYGMVVACNDDPLLRRMLPQIQRRTVTYGTRRGSDFHIKLDESVLNRGEYRPISRFEVTFKQKPLGEFRLHVPGVHNVLNATAAIAVGIGLDIDVEQIRSSLENFRGVDRRFQLRGIAAGISVIDDYGHHPTEVRATLAAARQCGFRKIHVVFQPHRYTRTQLLMDDFAHAFHDADTLLVLDIYAASELPIDGITGEALARRIREAGEQDACYAASFAEATEAVVARAHEGDMILTLGAGSVSQLGPTILEKLQAKQEKTPATPSLVSTTSSE
jgi:UDP-N-acetylmuramate--alanine ligase